MSSREQTYQKCVLLFFLMNHIHITLFNEAEKQIKAPASVIMVFFQFCKFFKIFPALGPLHMLFSLLRIFFPPLFTLIISSQTSTLYPSAVRPNLAHPSTPGPWCNSGSFCKRHHTIYLSLISQSQGVVCGTCVCVCVCVVLLMNPTIF